MTVDPHLSADELRRYARQSILPELGLEGQRRLAASRVLVIGAGGLGSPSLIYLAAAGVGTIAVVDDDVVDVSNLHRQVIHRDADIGRAKTESAAERVRAINPHVEVVEHRTRLTAANAERIVRDVDLVVDGSDNFPTRYLVNDAAVMAGIPVVWASISRFEGQISVWWAGHGPCYRCVFPTPPPAGSVPSCAVGGVLGVLPGVVGTVQASEAVKILAGFGLPLLGRLLLHDALAATWDTLTLRARPGCEVCGPNAGPIELRDIQECSADDDRPAVSEIDGDALARLLETGQVMLLDVREPAERATGALPGSQAWPLPRLLDGDVPTADHRPVVAYCASGIRSARAAALLARAGVEEAHSLAGGIHAWTGELVVPDA